MSAIQYDTDIVIITFSYEAIVEQQGNTSDALGATYPLTPCGIRNPKGSETSGIVPENHRTDRVHTPDRIGK